MSKVNLFAGFVFRPVGPPLLAFLASCLICVSPAAQTTNGVVDCSESGLRSAFGRGGGPYTFNCGGTNTITLTNTIVVSKNTILDGTGQTLAISGGNLVRLFTVNPGVKCTLMNLALISGEDSGTSGTNGAPGLSGSGGGVYKKPREGTLVSRPLSQHPPRRGRRGRWGGGT